MPICSIYTKVGTLSSPFPPCFQRRPSSLPDRLGGSLTGGGGLSLGGGGRGPERPPPPPAAEEEPSEMFLWGSRGISSVPPGTGGTGGGPGRLGGGGGAGAPRAGRGAVGTGGLLFCGGGGGRAASRAAGDLCPAGGGGGGGLSSPGRPGVGGSGGRPEKGDAALGPGCRRDPAGPALRLPGNGGGEGPRLGCRLTPGTGGEPLLYRLEAMGRGVLGTGGGTGSGLEPTSGLGGGRRLLCGSGAEFRGPEGGAGKRGGPLGGEKGLAAAERPPGGRAGGRAPPASADTGAGISLRRAGASPSGFRTGRDLRHCKGCGVSAGAGTEGLAPSQQLSAVLVALGNRARLAGDNLTVLTRDHWGETKVTTKCHH